MAWLNKHWFTICFFLMLLVGISSYVKTQFETMKSQLNIVVDSQEKMSAGIGYNIRRKKTVLALYNRIIESNPKLPKDLAYKIADYDYYVSAEIYKSFDPYLLLAIQWKETGGTFNPRIKNEASGATGLNQLLPTTAKWIAKGMTWQWNDSYLIDPFRNTDLSAAYLDFLFAELREPLYVLAWYNGGQSQYINVKNGGYDSLCKETKDYVRMVLAYRSKIASTDDIKEFEMPSVTDSVRSETKQMRTAKMIVDSSSRYVVK